MTGFWDDPDLKAGGDYAHFDNAGDTITGQIVNIKKHVFDDGKVAPQLLLQLQDGSTMTVSAGQIRLKIKLNELQPVPGDFIKITLTNVEKRAGGKTLKDFEVLVKPGTLPAATQEATALAQVFPAGAQAAAPVQYAPPVQQAAPVYQQPVQQAPAQDFEPPF
jgi:hypothetical protein